MTTSATTATTAKSTPIKASEASATAAIISLPDATQIDKDSILLAYVKEFYGEVIPPSNTGSDICKIDKGTGLC